jgi:hypothetical protein
MTWQPGGMGLQLFPQREINLLFRLDSFPANPDETTDQIKEIATAWERTGNVAPLITIDPRPDIRNNIKAYAGFLRALQTAVKREKVIVATIDPVWVLDDQKSTLEALTEGAGWMLLPIAAPYTPDTLIPHLKNFPYSTILLFPVGTTPDDLMAYDFSNFSSLVLTAITLDPSAPPPKPARDVGIFPKL